MPPIPGLKEIDYITNRRDFLTQVASRKHEIVLGAGPIGIEMAQAFSRLGTSVMVVDRAGQILGKEDPDMADVAVQAVMAGEGVAFYLGPPSSMHLQAGDKKSVALSLERWGLSG